MFSREFECPSCGAPVKQSHPGSQVLVCNYCGQTSLVNADTLEALGEKKLLIDYGSSFQIGKSGKYRGRDFLVLGRIRYEYEDGFWDEWYVSYLDDGSTAWVQEDDGSFVMFNQEVKLDKDISLSRVTVGNKYDYGKEWNDVFITSKSKAHIQGGEGELPFRIVPGEQADFIDGIWKGKVLSIELLPVDQYMYVGTPFHLKEIELA